MLLVVLLLQIMLIVIGVRLLLQANRLESIPKTSNSGNPTTRRHEGFGVRPDEVFRAPKDERVGAPRKLAAFSARSAAFSS